MVGEMKKWLRFRHGGTTGFGTLTASGISVHDGEMFDAAPPSRPHAAEIDDARTSLRVGMMTSDVSSRMSVDSECVAAVERMAS